MTHTKCHTNIVLIFHIIAFPFRTSEAHNKFLNQPLQNYYNKSIFQTITYKQASRDTDFFIASIIFYVHNFADSQNKTAL